MIELARIILEGHHLSNAWPLPVIVMVSDSVSIRGLIGLTDHCSQQKDLTLGLAPFFGPRIGRNKVNT